MLKLWKKRYLLVVILCAAQLIVSRHRSGIFNKKLEQKKVLQASCRGQGVLDRVFGKGDPANPALIEKTFNQGTILFEDVRRLAKTCSVYDQFSTRAHFSVIKVDAAAITQLASLRQQIFGWTEAERAAFVQKSFDEIEREHLFYVRAEVQDSPYVSLVGDDAAWQLKLSCGGERRNAQIVETVFDPEVARLFYRFDDSERFFGREYIVSFNRDSGDTAVQLYFLGAGVYDHLSW